MMKNSAEGTVAVVGVSIGMAFVVVSAIIHGWVVSTMWEWFIVPKFGLPPLGVAYAIGIVLLSRCIIPTKQADYDKGWSDLFAAVLAPLFPLLVGFVVKSFV